MNTANSVGMLAGEVALCRRAWHINWSLRRHGEASVRQAAREERRWWAACYARARQMLRTEMRMGAVNGNT